jgi:hypothetical protein
VYDGTVAPFLVIGRKKKIPNTPNIPPAIEYMKPTNEKPIDNGPGAQAEF